MKITIEKFFIIVLTILSFLGSTHFIINFLNVATPFYFFQIFISLSVLIFLIRKKEVKVVYERIMLLKYFFLFFFLNLFVQLFYHNLSIENEIRVLGYFLSFFSNVLALSFLFDRKDTFNFFIKLCKGILYTLIFFGIINSLNILNSNIFFVTSKAIDSYNFLFFKNTASLLEHQISYGSTIAILFSTLFFNKKIAFKFIKISLIIIGIFISFSRTAWLSMIFASTISFVRLKNFALLGLSIGLIYFIIPLDFFYNILRLENLGSGREVVWFYAIEMLKDNFLFGFGFSSYFDIKNMFLTNFELGLFEFDSTDHLHNSYLTLIFESGIIVFIVYIFAIIEQFLNLPQKNRNIFIYILFTFLIASFFVEFRLGGLRFFNFFFVAIIGYIISTRSVRLQKVELKKTT